VPEGVDVRVLPRAVRAELRGLPQELADIVAAHLVVAGQLVDDDPELAYSHAEAARRRAARLPIVREAAAETAYAAGHYDVALSEFRALRRMTGTDDYLPVMADCERALGRPRNALKLAREAEHLTLDRGLRVEMTIVEAGARADLGQEPEALRILSHAVADIPLAKGLSLPLARLRYAYADALAATGDDAQARRWFAAAAKLDVEGELDAQERVDALDGLLIDFDETEDEDEDVVDQADPDRDGPEPDHDQDMAADDADEDVPGEDGDAENGNAEDGDAEDGDAEDGDAEDGDPEDGDPEDGDPEDGDPEDGDPEDGDPEDGDAEDGDADDADPEDVDPEDLDPAALTLEDGDDDLGVVDPDLDEVDELDGVGSAEEDAEVDDAEVADLDADDTEGDGDRPGDPDEDRDGAGDEGRPLS